MTRLPAVAPDLEVADFGHELVVLVAADRRAVRLPPGPALVFDACRRGMDLDEAVPELAAALGTDRPTASGWVAETLLELARNGLVAPIDGVSDDSPHA